ncbi:astacin (Peptidase family m12A) domain-containing protein [Ditylenchus destructor]|nr:astacin (Peptidase family m12A) domain-containing protein [Ditylenchus destructor]
MRLIAFLCIVTLIPMCLSTPLFSSSVDFSTSTSSPTPSNTTAENDEGLADLAKYHGKSKAEWQDIRKSLSRLGEVGKKHNEEKMDFAKDLEQLHRNNPFERNRKSGIAKYLVEGDMVLTTEDIEKRLGLGLGSDTGNATRAKRQATTSPSSIWTLPIPYYFDSSANDKNKAAFRAAVALYKSKTCLTFTESSTPITNKPAIRVYNNPKGCLSEVGMNGGITSCSPCEDVNVASHELMHALGFSHHHCRSDRESYITVDTSKVTPGYESAFDICTNCDNQGLNYDYNSNMHYAATYFGANPGDITMTSDDPLYAVSLGGYAGPSYGDILSINKLYGCNGKCVGGAACYNGGYRNPANCNSCNCKTGFSESNGCVGRSTTCGQTLSATSSWQSLSAGITTSTPGPWNSGTPLTACDYHIQAPSGQVVEIQIQSAGTSQDCDVACMWRGTEFIVHSASSSYTGSGFRFCCPAQVSNQPIIRSEDSLAIVRPYSRTSPISFQIQYRSVSASSSLTVYDGSSYSGTSKTYSIPTVCSNSILNDGLNDMVSSIKVSGGCVRLWADRDCAGTYKEYSADTASMPDFDNSATSMGPCSGSQQTTGITVYDGANYAGTSKTYAFPTTCSNSILNDGFNDMASSIKVSGGCVRLWADDNCSGTYKEYSANTASMPDFDNSATSMGPCSGSQTTGITVYDGASYAGTSKTYTFPTACSNSIISDGFNDIISSIKVSGGCVRLWAGGSCTGIYKEYSADTASMPDFDNTASSTGPCSAAKATSFSVYDGTNYGGTSQTYAFPTTCSNSILNDGFNDMVSSIQIMDGCVRLWADDNCSGTYKEYSTSTASMPDFDNSATSMGPCTTGITVYDGANYAGTSKTYPLPTACSNSILDNGFNDMVSSVKVSGGCVRLWADDNCSGTYKQYSANTASMPDFDNTATSMGPCSA